MIFISVRKIPWTKRTTVYISLKEERYVDLPNKELHILCHILRLNCCILMLVPIAHVINYAIQIKLLLFLLQFAVNFVYCLVLIEVLKQLPYHPGYDDLINHIISQAFRHCRFRDTYVL